VHNTEKFINDLLDFERVPFADREPVSIPELVKRVLIRFPAPPSVKVTLKLPADLPKVYTDSSQIEQVLGKLVVNAYQSIKDSGELVINSQCSMVSEKLFVSIHVRDSGTGITPENMKRLFNPLFTTKTKGSGLGLAISKKLVEANDGRIKVESAPGEGSAFTVYLPVFHP
jgi:signal transduction histidine kinase